MDGHETQFDWVCGQQETPNRSSDVRLRDPNTGSPTSIQAVSEPHHIEKALECAADIHKRGVWSGVSSEDRANVLEQVARLLEGQVERLGRLGAATTGVVISQTEGFAALTPKIFRMAALLARADAVTLLPGPHGPVEVRGLPLGPALCIAPWNAPTVIAAHKVASALAAGCPTILKPSEWAPQTAQVLAEAIHRSDLPPGTFQLLHGTGRV
ncbi:MAG: aldehyde dehydrogenase family protein, partial [Myxococcota bacterium]|nr:aldehyde dehydrogenase family protein [Myxococcota bacterium]